MLNFEKLITKAKQEPEGDVYYTGIEVMNKGEESEYYIDPRTERNENNLNVVKPFCYMNGHYWYVCPDCQQIHYSPATYGGKRETQCCGDIDCQRIQRIGTELVAIQREPIVLEIPDL